MISASRRFRVSSSSESVKCSTDAGMIATPTYAMRAKNIAVCAFAESSIIEMPTSHVDTLSVSAKNAKETFEARSRATTTTPSISTAAATMSVGRAGSAGTKVISRKPASKMRTEALGASDRRHRMVEATGGESLEGVEGIRP